MAKSKKETKKDPMDMVFDLIDTINESIKNIHDRVDNIQKQIDALTEATKLSSQLHKGILFKIDISKVKINLELTE